MRQKSSRNSPGHQIQNRSNTDTGNRRETDRAYDAMRGQHESLEERRYSSSGSGGRSHYTSDNYRQENNHKNQVNSEKDYTRPSRASGGHTRDNYDRDLYEYDRERSHPQFRQELENESDFGQRHIPQYSREVYEEDDYSLRNHDRSYDYDEQGFNEDESRGGYAEENRSDYRLTNPPSRSSSGRGASRRQSGRYHSDR